MSCPGWDLAPEQAHWTAAESLEVDMCELGNTFIEKDLGSKPAPSENGLCNDFLHWDITESLSLASISSVPLLFASCPPSCTCVELFWWNSAHAFPEFHLLFFQLIKVLHSHAVLLSTSITHQIRWCFEFGDQNCSSSTVASVPVCPALLPPRLSQHNIEMLGAFPASSTCPGTATYTAQSILADSASDDITSGCITVTVSLIPQALSPSH